MKTFFIVITITSICCFFFVTFLMWLIPYGLVGSTYPPISDYWSRLLEGSFMGILALFGAIFGCLCCCGLVEGDFGESSSTKRKSSSNTSQTYWSTPEPMLNKTVQKICPKCGTPIINPSTQKYCTSCGSKLD